MVSRHLAIMARDEKSAKKDSQSWDCIAVEQPDTRNCWTRNMHDVLLFTAPVAIEQQCPRGGSTTPRSTDD